MPQFQISKCLTLVLLFFSSYSVAAIEKNGVIPSQFKKGYLSAGFETTYVDTNSNYDSGGNTYKLLNGYSFNMYQALLYSRFDLSNQLSMYGEMPMAYANSKNPSTASTKFNVNGVALGANYDLGLKFFRIILDLRGYLSIEKWNSNSTTILTSDGANKFDIGGHFFKKIGPLRAHGFASYEYRTNGFSGLLNYQIDGSYLFKENIFTLGLQGFKTIIHDQYQDSPNIRNNVLFNMNGQSLAVASMDPSQTNIFGMLKISANNAIDVYGSIGKSLQGLNTANQMTFMLGLEYFFEPIQYRKSEIETINSENKNDVKFEDEKTNESYEKEIDDFNRPQIKKSSSRHRDDPVESNYEVKEYKNDLQYSRKDWVKRKTPIKKSKHKKRIEVNF